MLHIHLKNIILGLIIPATAFLFYEERSVRLSPGTGGRINDNEDTAGTPKESSRDLLHDEPEITLRLFEKGKDFFSAPWDDEKKLDQMISAISHAGEEGLNPEDYHFSKLQRLTGNILMAEGADREDIRELESYLNDAFFNLASDMHSGKTNPAFSDPDWKVKGRRTTEAGIVASDDILKDFSITETLASLEPKNREYNNLKKALAEYRTIEAKGGWGSFISGLHKLEVGMTHPDVALLRLRLEAVQGRIYHDPGEEDYFDQNLRDQVIIFQRRNGLEPDGVVGKSTIEALNITVSERIEVIRANLERWRWIGDDLGERYILVNVPGFELQVFDNGIKVFRSLAIVGRDERETPIFSSELKYMVINPQWTVPPTILKDDILPALKKDSSYLTENNLKLVNSRGEELNPAFVDWDNVIIDRFPFKVRQEPGSNNPLGKIKFIFPNPYNVYIHDTPSKNLFARSTRASSSGCIRINNALSLALFLLKDDSGNDAAILQKSLESVKEQVIVLDQPVPVHIVYFTAWADDKGVVTFGRDIYDRDRKLITALDRVLPETYGRKN